MRFVLVVVFTALVILQSAEFISAKADKNR